MITDALTLLAGKQTWPVLEYFIHRYLFHNPWEEGKGANVHTQHHRHPEEYNTFTSMDGFHEVKHYIIPGVLGAVVILSPIVGPKKAILFTAGVIWGLSEYGQYHIQAHQDGPQNRRDRRLMKHHLIHHFRFPKANFGVTTDIFDKIFGTFEEVEIVPVPAHMAPTWLLNNPEAWAKDYKITGLHRLKKQESPVSKEAAQKSA